MMLKQKYIGLNSINLWLSHKFFYFGYCNNGEKVNDYLSICFQKQNGVFTVVANKNISDDIKQKLLKDISFELKINPIASYNFKDLKNYVVHHFEYYMKNKIIDNQKIIKDLESAGKIENVNYSPIISHHINF